MLFVCDDNYTVLEQDLAGFANYLLQKLEKKKKNFWETSQQLAFFLFYDLFFLSDKLWNLESILIFEVVWPTYFTIASGNKRSSKLLLKTLLTLFLT